MQPATADSVMSVSSGLSTPLLGKLSEFTEVMLVRDTNELQVELRASCKRETVPSRRWMAIVLQMVMKLEMKHEKDAVIGGLPGPL